MLALQRPRSRTSSTLSWVELDLHFFEHITRNMTVLLRILLLGSGGREHALAWKLSQSSMVQHVYVAPGNGGTAALDPRKATNIPDSQVPSTKFEQLLEFAVENNVNMLVPGPEAPLVDGVVDYFHQHGPARIACFGPSKKAAQMEGSKVFAKEFMQRHAIPTADFQSFTNFDSASRYLESHRHQRFVIKADGLAGGKGVIIPESHDEAISALRSIMTDREFGSAGDLVVLEEYLQGEEISILSFCDGHTIFSLPAAQDHKRALDNDQGLNTGGMGCYAPATMSTPEIMQRIDRDILQPTVDNMRRDGFPFVGCLFTGLMLTQNGPKVLEYNVRFGDPEVQTLLPLLDSDLADILLRCTSHTLDSTQLRIKNDFSTTVVVAAAGYPGKYDKNIPVMIRSLAENTYHFHAGTALDAAAATVKTTGGRVLAATATAPSIVLSVSKAYAAVDAIQFPGMHFRKDIAQRALKHQQQQQSSSNPTAGPLTYASTGVSITQGNALVSLIKSHLHTTARPGISASIGAFGGTVSLRDAGYGSDAPILLAAIDGVGTKILLARAVGDFSTVGIDLVAMNVNDIVVQGAEPLAFLDYYACGRLYVDDAETFVRGVCKGCCAAGCGLVGGETAEMPGVYGTGRGEMDAAGCAIGALKAGESVLPDKDRMHEGDVLLGLASSGPHSNGYSLIRKVVEKTGLSYKSLCPWDSTMTLGRALLTPTRIYVKSLLAALKRHQGAIKGMAHITGGGLEENIPRMLPEHLGVVLDAMAWRVPDALKWVKREGGVANGEFARAFNTGLGMVCVVDAGQVDSVRETLKGCGEEVSDVGRVVGGVGVNVENMSVWDE